MTAATMRQALEQCLAQERRFLFRLARSQLRDDQAADDAVQETALAAWQGIDRFEERASLRTWLVSILRFKILDSLRQRQREPVSIEAIGIEYEMGRLVTDDLLFNEQGQWADMPHEWRPEAADSECPDEALHHQQLLRMLQTCLDKLPDQTSRIFLMREYLGFESEEIAKKTGLQAGHVRVILSRVRLTLRTCLDSSLQRPVG